MPYNQIVVDPAKVWGSEARQLRSVILDLLSRGAALQRKTTAMIDGGNFTQVESQFGIPTGGGAAFVGQINSAIGKITTDASVDTVHTALLQYCDFVG